MSENDIMPSSVHIDAEAAVGETTTNAAKQWEKFWISTSMKKKRRKPITVEESKRRQKIKLRKNVLKRMRENKPVAHLLKDPEIAELLTERDFY